MRSGSSPRRARANTSLVPFGWGDGGGGPTREMLAAAHRTRDLEGSPTVRLARPSEFFAAAAAEYPDPPVWAGELYLEYHRGTYTTQARTKRGNRRSEHLLREAELWATTAAVRAGADYPAETLRRCWETVLLQQFHDILPGTSIAWVHRQAEREYARGRRASWKAVDRRRAHASLGRARRPRAAPPTRGRRRGRGARRRGWPLAAIRAVAAEPQRRGSVLDERRACGSSSTSAG